ncbi:MAG: hypothetical protein HZB41_03345, partial [Ignavibacteriae bacterium]|nr:hypothetical protein [Ignavibacteriota bacterium]
MKRNVYQNTMVKDLLSIIIALILLSISIYSQDNIWTIYNVGNSLPSDIVKGITVAPNGNVLIGTQSLIFGGGLAIYDGNTWKTIDITTPSFPSNNIYTVSTDKTGNIYIWYKNTKTSGGAIFNGSEWSPMNISGLDSTINLLKPLIFDNKERMWAGLHKSNFTGTSLGIGYYDSTWHNIKLDSNYYNFFINDMVFDKNDNLWVGTSYGIFKLNNNN